jgi:hypothetical protein
MRRAIGAMSLWPRERPPRCGEAAMLHMINLW